MFREYESFLSELDKKLDKFFYEQKDYICCKEGCSLCCKTGVYPATETEFLYVKFALEKLDIAVREKILAKIEVLKENKMLENGDRDWVYECPFLIDNKCAVYNSRPLVCRTFGLPWFDENKKIKVPSCIYEGLNYSNVFDPQTGQLSEEKFRQSGFVTEPLAFNLSRDFLHNSKLAKFSNVNFGEEKALLDWF